MTVLPFPATEYLPHVKTLTGGFGAVLRTADLAAQVPFCGDWRLRDLAVHLGNVHRWAAAIVRTGELQPQDFDHGPADDELIDWYADSAAVLLTALDEADPQDRCWHFCATPKEKAFWFRRQVHETAVHLVDATRAAGLASAVDPLVAADGVDEVLLGMLPKVTRWHTPPELAVPLLLRTTDTGHAWLIEPVEGGVPVARQVEAADAAATVESSAEELQLVVWGRSVVAGSGVRISGDGQAAEAFLAAPMTP